MSRLRGNAALAGTKVLEKIVETKIVRAGLPCVVMELCTKQRQLQCRGCLGRVSRALRC